MLCFSLSLSLSFLLRLSLHNFIPAFLTLNLLFCSNLFRSLSQSNYILIFFFLLSVLSPSLSDWHYISLSVACCPFFPFLSSPLSLPPPPPLKTWHWSPMGPRKHTLCMCSSAFCFWLGSAPRYKKKNRVTPSAFPVRATRQSRGIRHSSLCGQYLFFLPAMQQLCVFQ